MDLLPTPLLRVPQETDGINGGLVLLETPRYVLVNNSSILQWNVRGHQKYQQKRTLQICIAYISFFGKLNPIKNRGNR
jgi:hypothetical protein